VSAPVLVLISSKSEWRFARSYYAPADLPATPYGEWFTQSIAGRQMIFCQGGVGKVSAAASAEHAIQRWQPDVVINLGTCGGIQGQIEIGEIVLAQATVIYDIFEQMGDPAAALSRYAVTLDLAWLPNPRPLAVRTATLVSADRDLSPADLPLLRQRFNAIAADWESGAIAWVCQRRHLPCLILRGVTDLVNEQGGQADGNLALYRANTPIVMGTLLDSLPNWIT
jgi:adenosylhomocysteine nucleosidase